MTALRGRIVATLLVVSLGSIPICGSARAAEAPDACVKALAQLLILADKTPVFKQGPGASRTYLADRDRPGEIALLQERVAVACSTGGDVRRQQDADAKKLVVALSVRCVEYREELAALLGAGSRATDQDIERHRVLVDEYCPEASREDIWLPGRLVIHRPD